MAGLAEARGGKRGDEKGEGGVLGWDRDVIDAAEDKEENKSWDGGAGDAMVLRPNGDGWAGVVENERRFGRRGGNIDVGAGIGGSAGVGMVVDANEACAAARNGHAV